jgi:hypothetical protein
VPEAKVYLGDAVYAAVTELGLELTTEDGVSVTNRIVLEPEVLEALSRFLDRFKETRRAS